MKFTGGILALISTLVVHGNAIAQSNNWSGVTCSEMQRTAQAVAAERIHAQELWEQAELGLPQILDDGAIRALRAQRAALLADYQQKLSTFKSYDPDMLRLKAQMNQIDQEIKSEADVIKQSLKSHYEAALQQETLVKNKMEYVKERLRSAGNTCITFFGK